MSKNTCCFIGHREIDETNELKEKIRKIVEDLIIVEKVDTFYFGSKSRFNDLCLEIVTKLKEKYPYIKRIYVRAEFPYIDNGYLKYLLESYEEAYFPEKMTQAGKAVYVERNFEMIRNSEVCVIYYNENKVFANRKSGTEIAVEYAKKQNKRIINVALL